MAKNSKREIWTVDAETDPFRKGRVPKPFIWGVYTGAEYYEFTETEKLVQFLEDKHVIVYAHNGGKFDWHFLTDYIPDFSPLTVIAGRLAKFSIGECEFRDSYNIIPAPLSAYKKDEISYDIFEESERNKPENWKAITEYLKSDCIYLHEMIETFIDEYGLNLTQASAAMKVWSKMSGIKKPQSSDLYYSNISQYYYGGRVECFQTGIIEKAFSVVDINSAYPYAMTFEHPWGLIYSTHDCMPDLPDDELGRCFITLDAASMGAFPMRGKNGLSFPNDGEIREFHITGWEYLAARDTNCLCNENVKVVREYFETVNFREYVERFFDMKDKAKSAGDAARYLFAKLFLNSLYGKFASNPENYQEFMTIPASMIDGAQEDGWNYCKLLCEETAVVNKQLEEEKRRYYDVAVSASITGFVRAYLWRNIDRTNNTILYCDTDSIAAMDVSGIILSDLLGDWDLEAQCDYAAIAGKKLYAFRKLDGSFKTASKGVRLDPKDIIDIAKGEEITYVPEAPTFSIKRSTVFTPRKIKMIEN
jgi:hypothetical protein